jgi:hypothetical protein
MGILRAGRLMRWAVAVVLMMLIPGVSCQQRPYGRVTIAHATAQAPNPPSSPATMPEDVIDPIARYGGYVLTAGGMPHGDYSAYLWAKQMGTLVAYETFLRRHPDSGYAKFFRSELRRRFTPIEKEWQEAWQHYSTLEVIDGAIMHPDEGLILIGRRGTGRLAPFLYEDLIVALRCSLAGEKVGVTMNRVFEARFDPPEDPARPPYVAFETSVHFYSKQLWNTHLAYVIFEGDRMLKSLSAGYDIFLREPVRSEVPGFLTEIEMAAAQPPPAKKEGTYGRIWIELLSVKINTTEQKNVAMLDQVNMEVRAESQYDPPLRFAKHLQDNYPAFAQEFPIFGEIERAARVISIARWMVANYPDAAKKLVDGSYDDVKVYVPQAIKARWEVTHETREGVLGLVGGVVFPNVNRYANKPESKVADTRLSDVPAAVLRSRPDQSTLAWESQLGRVPETIYTAWKVTVRPAPNSASAKNSSQIYNDHVLPLWAGVTRH